MSGHIIGGVPNHIKTSYTARARTLGLGLTIHRAKTDALNIELDLLRQPPGLQIYTQICLCFVVEDISFHSEIVLTLRKGLERLSANFPRLEGQIVNGGSG
ncbi:hypothetical protein BDV29DRAFT_8309 [Aspergillus leporis]|jgi:hypothetical protein|uniref:Trichothecene 3-O-acetyltransferase-like N-terminal domain-containing protein n=1 Tax=Aspergillus leporis TaxID=41062 RepID=A0A5N5WW87_9EURO|nr:hypothetical protein BDV29DRAFT_8309 [Aspergillus leporis]